MPPPPIQLHIPPSLLPYTTSLTTFLANQPIYSNVAVSAIILSPPTSLSPLHSHQHQHPPSSTEPPTHTHNHNHSPPETATPRKILLLRRALTERAFPNKWELPGGSAETSDPTILHSVAREVFEETGLRVGRFVREVGGGEEGGIMRKMDFSTGEGEGKRIWAKRVFEVEVVEMVGMQRGEGEGQGRGEAEVEVELDPEEHTEFLWVDRGEVRRLEGEMVSEAVYMVVMEGLEG